MNKNEIKTLLSNLLIDFHTLEPDLKKFNGNPTLALAEKLIIMINTLTPHAHLFDDAFKKHIKMYIIAYEGARKGEETGKDIFKLITPTAELIDKTIKDKLDSLG